VTQSEHHGSATQYLDRGPQAASPATAATRGPYVAGCSRPALVQRDGAWLVLMLIINNLAKHVSSSACLMAGILVLFNAFHHRHVLKINFADLIFID
jgi:hypothetical protein